MTKEQNTPVPDSGLVDIRSIIRDRLGNPIYGSTDEACEEVARKQQAADQVKLNEYSGAILSLNNQRAFLSRRLSETKSEVAAAVTVERDSWVAFIKEHIVKDEDEFDIDAAEAIYFGIFLIPYDALEARSEVGK